MGWNSIVKVDWYVAAPIPRMKRKLGGKHGVTCKFSAIIVSMFEGIEVEDLLSTIDAHDFSADPDIEFGAARIDAIVAFERIIRAAQARQLAQINALYTERMEQIPLGSGDAALSVIGEVGMARNVSPGAAGTQFGAAIGLAELPQTAAALEAGQISEPTARAIVRETDALARDDRIVLDGEIADTLPGLTSGRAARLARHHVIALDADAAHDRAERNRADQRVSLHPDLDGVAILMVRGPAEQLVAAHQALTTWAKGLRATGDERSMSQIMCATLVERVTGMAHADTFDVEIGITIPADALLGADDSPAELDGFGPITPGLVDDLIGKAHRVFYRRLITDPVDHTLIGRDPRRRRFDGPLSGFVRARDRHRCRQPGCDCGIGDIDHITDYANGGGTTSTNGQGLCRRSHTLKHQPGWTVTSRDCDTIWQTPTGHTYTSPAPTVLTRRRM